MNMGNKDFRSLYGAYYRFHKNQPAYEEKKRQFLSTYFAEPAPAFSFHPLFAVPIVCMVFLLVFFEHLQTRLAPQSEMLQSAATRQETSLATGPSPQVTEGLIEVERATSRVGSVMVYQKIYQDTPITIVWVFNHRSAGT